MSDASKTSDTENLVSLLMSGGYLHVAAGKEIARLTAELEIARKALERSMVAIDDWLHSYAGEFCDPACVEESAKRIGEYGTIGYIAHVQEQNRAALQGQPK